MADLIAGQMPLPGSCLQEPVIFLDDTYEDKKVVSYGEPLGGRGVALPSGFVCGGRAKKVECGIGVDQSAGQVL
jgi:hypothetical protein